MEVNMGANYRFEKLVQVGLLGVLAIAALPAQLAQSVQLADGRVFFTNPPRLLGARTLQNSVAVRNADYRFTLEIPENAGEPLKKVIFTQISGVKRISFNPRKTRAFVAPNRKKNVPIDVDQYVLNKQRQVHVSFDPPVQPGETITINLKSFRNPIYSGIYQFGVTAIPAGENAQEQFLGYGRLHFYKGSW